MASENKDEMAATPHKITLKDKSGVTQTWMVSDKILRDMNATKRYAEATGSKPDYSSVLRLGVRTGEVVLASRPGAPDTFAVEDRFYFGKGRKERFAEKNDGWALQSVNVPDWGTHHFPSEAAARKYAVEKGYNFELRLLYNGKTVAIKRWDNTWSNR